jgi:hypothetical protein
MLSRLGAKNLNTALKGMRVKLKDMCVKLRKLLKRRRRDTEQPRAKSPGFGGDKYVSPVRAKQDWKSYEDSECDIFLASPFQGLNQYVSKTQDSASLHPGLFCLAPSAHSPKGLA